MRPSRVLRPRRAFLGALMMMIAALLQAATTAAEEFPPTHLNVVGGLGNVNQYTNIEEPFWTRRLAEISDGRITAEVTPSDVLGLRANDMVQLMRLGVITFGTFSLSQLAEDAQAAAIDLPGLNPDIGTLRRNVVVYRETLSRIYSERYGITVLAMWTYPAQVLFCTQKIARLGDLAGKRIRVASAAHADFVEALGATGLTLPFNQAVDALRRGAVDCAITGTLSGNFIKLYNVTSHLYALPISWGPSLFAANTVAWNHLAPAVREFLSRELALLEQKIWDNAEYETEQGIACNIGRPDCKLGTRANMTLDQIDPADKQVIRQILTDVILPRWSERCGVECVQGWNETIGALVDLKATAK
jgi:TRAP-type C4-dicarboxylate transport system substrate-binding protein